MKIKAIALAVLAAAAAFPPSSAQARVMYFSATGSTNMRADAGGHAPACVCLLGLCTCTIAIRCSIFVTNISNAPQTMTNWSVRYGIFQPSAAPATNPDNPFPAGQVLTHVSNNAAIAWRFNSQAAANTPAVVAPGTVLAPFGTGNDSLRIWVTNNFVYRFNRGSQPLIIPLIDLQGMPTFAQPAPPAIPYPLQYFPDFFGGQADQGLYTYTGSVTMPEHVKATHVCSGTLTVDDVVGQPSGLVVATGEMDYIGDSYQNPNFQIGARLRAFSVMLDCPTGGGGPTAPNPETSFCENRQLTQSNTAHTWAGGSMNMQIPGSNSGRVNRRSTLDTHNAWQSSVANVPILINAGKPF